MVALPTPNVDTDQIIPARFLKATNRVGFGAKLFYDWRFMPDGSHNPGFVLNQSGTDAKILLAGQNFGCGSSREHAAWALYEYGFRVIISSGFADIFINNALNNGILPVELSPEQLNQLFATHQHNPKMICTIDLSKQHLTTHNPQPTTTFSFPINPFRKHCLLSGLDLVDYLVSLKPAIEDYENQRTRKNEVLSWSLQ